MNFPNVVPLREENASQSQCVPVVMLRRAARRSAMLTRAPLPLAVGA